MALASWFFLLKEFEVYGVLPHHCRDIFQLDRGLWGNGSLRKKLWNVAVIGLCWTLWLESNNRIFDNIEGTIDSVWERVKFGVALWVFNTNEFNGLLFSSLVRSWFALLS